MTERTLKEMAIKLAGIFYEDSRTPAFRQAFPTLKAYMRGQWHQQNGDIKIDKPGWMYHIDMARKILVSMLGRKDVTEPMKERIYAAIIEDHQTAKRPGAKKVTQRIETQH